MYTPLHTTFYEKKRKTLSFETLDYVVIQDTMIYMGIQWSSEFPL